MSHPLSAKRPEHTSRQVERHLNAPLVPILTGLFGFLYILTGYRGWLVFMLGIGGAFVLAFVWVRSLEKNLWLERKIHIAWATVGESVPEQVKLVNHGWLPAVWVEISDDSSTLARPLRLVSDVEQHASRNRHISHLFKRRGLYHLGPTLIRTGDPLGIYTLSLRDQHADTVLVTPPLLPLMRLKILPGGWAGDERPRSGVVQRNISEAGLRDYVPGDSLRRIHWRASAHADSLIVRQMEAASTNDWIIIVDLDRSVQAGSGEHSTLELCIILAASLAVRGLRERRRVGLLLAGPGLAWIEPSAQPAQRWRILRILAMAEAGKRPLGELLSLRHSNQPVTSIVITPSTNPSWVATASQQRKGGMMGLLVDPQDFGGWNKLDEVMTVLARRRIGYVRMPGGLLEEAYFFTQKQRRQIMGQATPRKLSTPRGRADWLSTS